jgi:hypothetical protein
MGKSANFLVGRIVQKKDCVQGVGRFDSIKGVKKGSGWLRASDETMIHVRFLTIGEATGASIFETTDFQAAGLEKGAAYPYFSELEI